MSDRTPPRVLALADDLTGALEVGAVFAARGLKAAVSTGRPPDVAVSVVDTESRHLDAGEAQQRVRRALAADAWLVYKKTDSTLRGNITAELAALAEAFPERGLIYAPAYPALGRTVRDGALFVDGLPIAETAFASDTLNPIYEGDVRRLVGDLPATVLDGETDEDILAAADRILFTDPPALAAGPAGLAAALARRIGHGAHALEVEPVRRCLVVNGSRHPASLVQVDAACGERVFDDGWELFDEPIVGEGVERARRLGRRVVARIRDENFDGLVVFGGDTAFGIHAALGAPLFQSLGEVLPGVPASRTPGLLWITKAGGFGEPDVLGTIRRRLS